MSLPKYFNSVTPLSKILAVILFAILPIISFFIGIKYGMIITPQQEKIIYTPVVDKSGISQIPIQIPGSITENVSTQSPSLAVDYQRKNLIKIGVSINIPSEATVKEQCEEYGNLSVCIANIIIGKYILSITHNPMITGGGFGVLGEDWIVTPEKEQIDEGPFQIMGKTYMKRTYIPVKDGPEDEAFPSAETNLNKIYGGSYYLPDLPYEGKWEYFFKYNPASLDDKGWPTIPAWIDPDTAEHKNMMLELDKIVRSIESLE